MNVLEKILEEIKEAFDENIDDIEDSAGIHHFAIDSFTAWYIARKIIRSHMDEQEVFKFDFNRVKSFDCQCGRHYVNTYNDGWIPVSEKLPEVGEMVKVTVHSSEWIADYDSAWVPKEEKTYHPEERNVYDGYIDRVGMWRFYDEEGSVNACDKEFGTNKGIVYDVVTAWMPIEPYKEEVDENRG